MGNITKKIVAIATVLTLSVMVVPSAQGQTVSELQALINSLTAQIAALTAQLAALTGGTTGGGVTGCTITSFNADLSMGSTGADVKCLQIILNSSADTKIAASGAGSPGNETEYFGSLTEAAVIKFQNKYASEVLTPIGLTAGTGYVGAKTRAKLNTLLTAGGGTVTPPVTGGPLTVSLAATTPAAGNLLKGEANKKVTSLQFCASATANTQINSLTVQSYGTAETGATSIANVKMFEGTTQIGLTQTQVAGISNFVFAPAINITAGTCKVLDVAVDVAAGATTLATVKMGVNSAANIGGAAFTGAFPIAGNSFSIVPGGSLGTLSVTAGPVVPSVTTRVGATDVVLGNFVISAGPNEDVDVTQFTVAATNTMQDTDVSNVRIKVDGAQVGNAASFSLRRATIDLVPAIRVTKGTSRAIQVIGNVTAGVGRIIEVGVQANNVFARGVVSGAGLGGPAAAFYLSTPNNITIGRGALTVAVSTVTPQGSAASLVKSVVAQTLGVYDVRAIGEDVLINTVNLVFNTTGGAGTGTVASVGLYDENGALLSGLVNLAAAGATWGGATNTFSVSWTIPKDTTKKLYIKGITNGVTGPDPAAFTVQLVAVGGTTIVGTGLVSAGTEGANNVTSASTLALPAVSISQGPSFTAAGAATATPRNQAILSPVSQANIATIRVTAQREDQTLRSLTLTGTTSAASLANYFSGVALFDGATQVTNFVIPGATTIAFASSDVLVPVTFVQGVAKDLSIVVNVLGSINATTASTSIASGNMVTAGVTSGQTATNSAVSLTVNSGGLGVNTGGVVTAYTDVLEIAKSATCPSGNIGRATFDPTASWVLTHRGTDAAGVDVTSVTFTSLTGFPSGIATDTLTSLFRLYDETAGAPVTATTTMSDTAGTVTFAITAGNLRVAPNVPKTITLQVTTTNTTYFPTGSVLEWTVRTAANITVVAATGGAARGAGYGGTVWSIPANANQVTIP